MVSAGYVDDTDYEYEESKSVIDGQFLGLPIDEDNEDDKSDARVEACASYLIVVFNLFLRLHVLSNLFGPHFTM